MAVINGQEISPQLLDALLRGDNPQLSGPSQQDLIAAIMRGDFGDQTSRWAEQAANPYWGFGGRPGNLTPEQLASLKQGIVPEGYTVGVGGYESRGDQGNDSAQDPYYVLYQGMEDPTWGTGKWNTWDLNGNYLGCGSADSELRGLVKAAAIAAAMYGGASYGANAMGGEAGASGGMSGMDIAADAGMGSVNSGGGMTWGGGEALTGTGGMSGMDMAADAGMSSPNSGGGTTWGGGGATPTATGGTGGGSGGGTGGGTNSTGSAWEAGVKALTNGGDWTDVATGLLGAWAGYQDSKDKENTQKTEPWGPAQPYLKGLLGEGASVYDQYKQQPFSPAEQTAYSNYGNTLDFINANAPGLMSGFDATARGANQFSRNNPRRGLIGNSYDAATSPVAWNPGLLGSFGTRKG